MSTTLLPPDYVPSDEDDFMNPLMTEFFSQRLIEWRNELVRESDQTLINIQTTNNQEPDISDRASLESNRALELRTRDRGRKLISKIDTDNNLILLNANPPIDLVTSAEIRDAIAQQKAAKIAIK